MKKISFMLGLVLVFFVGALSALAAEYPKMPILMVHGMGGSTANWSTMISRLKANGYTAQQLYTVSITPNAGVMCSENHMAQVIAKVEQIVAESGSTRVDVMGHSRGGLNLYDYMRFDNGPNRVRNWISMGGANNWPCSMYGNPPADRTPGSGTLYTSIYSTADVLVSPAMASIDGAKNISVDGVNHLTMPSNSTIIALVLEALNGTGLNDGQGIPVENSPAAPVGLRSTTEQ